MLISVYPARFPCPSRPFGGPPREQCSPIAGKQQAMPGMLTQQSNLDRSLRSGSLPFSSDPMDLVKTVRPCSTL